MMRTQRAPLALLVQTGLLLALCCAAAPALAHPGHKGSERMLKLDLASEPARFIYALILEPEAAADARKRADQDTNGSVSEAEGTQALSSLGRDFLGALTLCRGPSLDEVVCAPVSTTHVLSARAEGWTSAQGTLALSWEVRLDLAEQDGAVRVDEAWPQAHVVSTAAVIEPHPERAVTRAGFGPRDTPGVTLEQQWGEPEAQGPRTLFASWEPPARPFPVLPIALMGSVVLASALVLRKRRAARPTLPASENDTAP
jgi:hypothetical protein